MKKQTANQFSEQILNALNTSTDKITISGVQISSAAYLLFHLLRNSNQKFVVVAPSAEDGDRLLESLKTFLTTSGSLKSASYFPGWENSPYLSVTPSIATRIGRLKNLHRLLKGSLDVLVTDAAAFRQKTLPLKAFVENTKKIGLGDFVTRAELHEVFSRLGYSQRDTVEDAGSYNFRGGILDFFSPAMKHPVRVEFFGDEIEKIRFFNPSTQMSFETQTLDAEISPVLPFFFDPSSLALAKSKIKAYCDAQNISKTKRDAFFERLELGVRDPELEYLFPYFHTEPCDSLLDYLKKQSYKIVLFDGLDIQGKSDLLNEDLRKQFEEAKSQELLLCPPDELCISGEEFDQEVLQKARLQMDSLQIGVDEDKAPTDEDGVESEPVFSKNTRLKVLGNTDLRALSQNTITPFLEKAKLWENKSYIRAVFASTRSQSERIRFFCEQNEIVSSITSSVDWAKTDALQIASGNLASGFRIPSLQTAIVTDAEIFGPKKSARQPKEQSKFSDSSTFISSLTELGAGGLVVHKKHGIGKYLGLVKLELEGIPQDFLLMEYSGADKLYLPVYRLDQVQKYIGSVETVTLDKLGSGGFEKTKEKVKQELQEVAHKLLEIYAQRAMREGFQYSPPDDSYREFEARFPFSETTDQLKAIEDVLDDMQSPKIMDRLVCGDVGYGKTEVAMRASYKAVLDGKQVAVLVPTTILALQHERSFTERFKNTAVRVGSLSRFKSTKEIKANLEALKEQKLDIVVGTHRLLSRDVEFKNLGLIIVDEEQRFGVEHKERLKQLKLTADVLTLTATPIPRTLHLSLAGLRDISIINTPPADRLSIRTYVAKFDENLIRKAVQQEIARGGQVFFLYNRVQSIDAFADRLKLIVPEARVLVAHGQLSEDELEKRMLRFYNKEADVLLCSTIIESGLDLPSVNTMIINRADMFGLSQLYQLRGRVGRSQHRAYCYLLLPEGGQITEDAKQRLEVLQRFADLGAGFKIAAHDLEMRGGGDILGRSQSGHIAAIGYELYMDLLSETIQQLKGQQVKESFDPEIKLPIPALIPDDYIPDVPQRIGFYKKLADTENEEQIHQTELELMDRYGPIPVELQNLVWLIRIKQVLKTHRIKTLVVGKEKISIEPSSDHKLSLDKLMLMLRKSPKTMSLTPDSKVILNQATTSIQSLHQNLSTFFAAIAEG